MRRFEVADRVKVCSNTASGEASVPLIDSEFVAQIPVVVIRRNVAVKQSTSLQSFI
jgi:hypothetical protein